MLMTFQARATADVTGTRAVGVVVLHRALHKIYLGISSIQVSTHCVCEDGYIKNGVGSAKSSSL